MLTRNYSTINFFDGDLYNEKDIFFKTMDSFHSQRKEEEDFNNETEEGIEDINYYYDMEKLKFSQQFKEKKKQYMDDYSESLNYFDNNRQAKIINMNEIYNNASKKFLERIENKRLKTIQSYKKERKYQYNNLVEKHQNFLKKQNKNLLLLDEKGESYK